MFAARRYGLSLDSCSNLLNRIHVRPVRQIVQAGDISPAREEIEKKLTWTDVAVVPDRPFPNLGALKSVARHEICQSPDFEAPKL